MAELLFDCLFDCLQRPESLPQELLSSNEGLRFGDICFVLLPHTLNMQQVSLAYLKSSIGIIAFQPKAYKDDMYSSSIAIFLVFLCDDQHEAIKYIHIVLVVCCMGCNITTQAEILPFVLSIESDLAKVRDRHAHEKSIGRAHSYSLLVGNYGGAMALPTELPYCLVYPTTYDDEAEDKAHFNTAASPSGMPTDVCMCHSLLHLMDKDPANRRE